jgi:hypothetical protein
MNYPPVITNAIKRALKAYPDMSESQLMLIAQRTIQEIRDRGYLQSEIPHTERMEILILTTTICYHVGLIWDEEFMNNDDMGHTPEYGALLAIVHIVLAECNLTWFNEMIEASRLADQLGLYEIFGLNDESS